MNTTMAMNATCQTEALSAALHVGMYLTSRTTQMNLTNRSPDMASRRSRERANARPCEHEPDEPEHDDTERCPNTGDMFEDKQEQNE